MKKQVEKIKKQHWLFFIKNRLTTKTPTNPYHNKQASDPQKIKKNNQKNNQPILDLLNTCEKLHQKYLKLNIPGVLVFFLDI